jgi:hypothetical protein
MQFEKYIDQKLEQISGAGNIFGRFLGLFGRHASKVVVALVILVFFGIALFIWSTMQGMKRKK